MMRTHACNFIVIVLLHAALLEYYTVYRHALMSCSDLVIVIKSIFLCYFNIIMTSMTGEIQYAVSMHSAWMPALASSQVQYYPKAIFIIIVVSDS